MKWFVALLFAGILCAQDSIVKITGTGPRSSTANVSVNFKSALVTFTLGSGIIDGAGAVSLPVSIVSKNGQLPAGLQFDLAYTSSDVSTVAISVGPAATAAQKTVSCAPQSTTPPSVRCIISGINATVIQDGVVALVTVQTSLTSQSTTTTALLGTVAASVGANAIKTAVTSGGGVISMPALLVAARCSQPDIWDGLVVPCTATVNKPAPAGGLAIALASDSTLVVVPASVQIAAGATSATFSATGKAPLLALVGTPKGPNQVNLAWAAPSDPGYGYLVEAQSDGDSRYASYVEVRPIPPASGYTCDPAVVWHGGVAGCDISDPAGAYVHNPPGNGVPPWVTEPHYLDPQDGTPAQFIVHGLKNNTAYQFRIRTYTGTNPVYGAYSAPVTVSTANYLTRYISPTGSDSNDGTAADDAHAWQSLYKLGEAACGTVVMVKEYDYNASIGLSQNCTADAKLVVQAFPGEHPRIATNPHPDWGSSLSIWGTHIVIDGLGVSENYQTDYVVSVAGSHNALLGMNVGPTIIPSAYGGIDIKGASNLVYDSYVHDFGSPSVAQNGSGNGGFLITLNGGDDSINNVVWSNHLTRGAHDCGLVHGSSYSKFLNNIADGGWGMAFETVYPNSTHNLFEGYVSRFAGALEAGIYKPAFELSYKSNTVRRSVFTDAGKAIEISAYDNTTDNAVYNNIFYNVSLCYFQSHNGGPVAYDGVRVQNNICAFNGNATEIYLNNATPGAIGNNSFRRIGGDGTEATAVWNQDAGAPFAYPVTLSYAEANYGPAWVNNADLSLLPVKFVDAARMDFHLAAGSPLLKAGAPVVDPNYPLPAAPVNLGVFGNL